VPRVRFDYPTFIEREKKKKGEEKRGGGGKKRSNAHWNAQKQKEGGDATMAKRCVTSERQREKRDETLNKVSGKKGRIFRSKY